MRLRATSAFVGLTLLASTPTSAQAPPCVANQPPTFSARFAVAAQALSYGSTDATLRAGRRVEVVLEANDPEGQALTFAAKPIPEGATFDAARGVLTWQPTPAQIGRHPIAFEVSDGVHAARRPFALHVQENRAPSVPSDYPLVLLVGGPHELRSIAWDPDQDELRYVTRALPAGARLVAAPGRVALDWKPSDADLGEHEVAFDVSDGLLTSTVRVKVLVAPAWAAKENAGWLLLGGGPSAFLTQGSGELLIGGAVEATLVAIRESASRAYACSTGARNSDCHAMLHRFYAQLEVLDSLRAGSPSMFSYGIGYSASFEWYPGRRWLVPHYGVEVGGLVQRDAGHLGQARPYLGMHLWTSDRVWVNAALGYRIVPAALATLSGPTAALGVVVHPW